MSERLTAEQVARNFDLTAIGFESLGGVAQAAMYREVAAFVREHLAPQWQDEPSVSGWHWVEKGGARHVWRDTAGTWWAAGAGGDRRLNGRRVCPIQGPPQS